MLPNRYEDEINKRAAAENEFVLLKKVKIQKDLNTVRQKALEFHTRDDTGSLYITLSPGC